MTVKLKMNDQNDPLDEAIPIPIYPIRKWLPEINFQVMFAGGGVEQEENEEEVKLNSNSISFIIIPSHNITQKIWIQRGSTSPYISRFEDLKSEILDFQEEDDFPDVQIEQVIETTMQFLEKLNAQHFESCRSHLKVPDATPSGDNGIYLRWKNNDGSLLIRIPGKKNDPLIFSVRSNGLKFEGRFERSQIKEIYDMLYKWLK